MDINRILGFVRAGYSVIPTNREDKKPIYRWDRYKTERAGAGDVRRWWRINPDANVAVICGNVSGGLQVIDFDYEAATIVRQWWRKIDKALRERLAVVRTGKGYHVWFRTGISGIRKSTKLSLDEERRVLVELKGECGYVIAPPSWHSGAGREYEWVYGNMKQVPFLKPEEIETMLAAAESFDKYGLARARKIKEARANRPRQAKRKPSNGGNDTVATVKDSLNMVEFAQHTFGSQATRESEYMIRIPNNGGLLINTDENVWYCHADSIGGDPIDLVGYSIYMNAWTPFDREMFVRALHKAAEFAGVKL